MLLSVLRFARALGAETAPFVGEMINLPMYAPDNQARCARVESMLEAVRQADAIVLGSPGYHGGVSGLVKNALDYIEDLSQDPTPYLEGRAVGCIATGAGWQGANTTLNALRNTVHALRGWPTPLGIALNTKTPLFSNDGECLVEEISGLARVMAEQLVGFAARFS
jgi:FMN reductase